MVRLHAYLSAPVSINDAFGPSRRVEAFLKKLLLSWGGGQLEVNEKLIEGGG